VLVDERKHLSSRLGLPDHYEVGRRLERQPKRRQHELMVVRNHYLEPPHSSPWSSGEVDPVFPIGTVRGRRILRKRYLYGFSTTFRASDLP
jgi:hypothetical protein